MILNKMMFTFLKKHSKFRILLIRISKVLVKRSFLSNVNGKTVRLSEWSDLSGVRLKRTILA